MAGGLLLASLEDTSRVHILACSPSISQSIFSYTLPIIRVTLLDLLQGPFLLKCLSPLACSNRECMHQSYTDCIQPASCVQLVTLSCHFLRFSQGHGASHHSALILLVSALVAMQICSRFCAATPDHLLPMQ